MVRRHTGDPIDRSVLDRIVDAGLRSPSAGNARGQRLVVVTRRTTIERIAIEAGEPSYLERGFDPWLSTAGALVVVCVDPTAYAERYGRADKSRSKAIDPETGTWIVPYWWVDAGASLMSILLAAVDEGLSAGFLGAHSIPAIAEIVAAPDHVEVVGVVTIGPAARDRRSSSLDGDDSTSRVFRNRWGQDD